jgi:SAM-dependent methyltransferase
VDFKDQFLTNENLVTVPSPRPQKDYNSIWENHPGGFGPANPEMLEFCNQYATKPRGESRIIDIASGNGRYALEFARLGFGHVVALDISVSVCDLIRVSAAHYPQIEISQTNLLSVNDSECRQYDIVFSSGLIEEFDNAAEQVAAVTQMQNMVCPSGLLVMRYCLFISNRVPEERVSINLVRSQFTNDQWNVVHFSTDPEPQFNQKSTIPDRENIIRRQTIVASKLGKNGL